jgi:hypothetical protein
VRSISLARAASTARAFRVIVVTVARTSAIASLRSFRSDLFFLPIFFFSSGVCFSPSQTPSGTAVFFRLCRHSASKQSLGARLFPSLHCTRHGNDCTCQIAAQYSRMARSAEDFLMRGSRSSVPSPFSVLWPHCGGLMTTYVTLPPWYEG